MEHKECQDCGQDKLLSDFRWRNKVKGYRHNRCKNCDSIFLKEYRSKIPKRISDRNKRAEKNRRRKILNGEVKAPSKKICIDCKKEKSVSFFRVASKSLLRWKPRCKSCDSDNRKKKYPSAKAGIIRGNKRVYKKLRKVVIELKDKPCMDCGIKYSSYVMDFDHREPKNKIDKVSAMVYKGSLELLLEEIKKCDLVCSNCHRERTFGGVKNDKCRKS